MEEKYHSFEDLWIWQLAMEWCDEVYAALRNCRDFRRPDQMQKRSVLVPSSIAVGFELQTKKALIRHRSISKDSAVNSARNFMSPPDSNTLIRTKAP